MSTKIYQACRINTGNFKKILELCQNFKPWLTQASEEKMDTFIAEVNARGKKGLDLWYDLRGEQKKTGHRMPMVDTDFSLSLIPCGNYTLGIVYTENRAWFQEWLKQPGVSEYGYWNNTDKPDEISTREWSQRRRNWNRVLDANPVCVQSFSIDLVDPSGPIPKGWRSE